MGSQKLDTTECVLSQCDTGIVVLMFFSLEQQASTFLAPRINLVEDNFSMDQRQEMFWGRFKCIMFIVLLWESRQHIKNQRHYFVNKGSSSQGYGLSSSHVWMWELDHKESWALKNWCFWTVVLEKTLESPLDCKEIQPVNPKGNQPWIFTRSAYAEPETPIFWPPDAKNWLIRKDPDAGKDWRQEKGTTWMRW